MFRGESNSRLKLDNRSVDWNRQTAQEQLDILVKHFETEEDLDWRSVQLHAHAIAEHAYFVLMQPEIVRLPDREHSLDTQLGTTACLIQEAGD